MIIKILKKENKFSDIWHRGLVELIFQGSRLKYQKGGGRRPWLKHMPNSFNASLSRALRKLEERGIIEDYKTSHTRRIKLLVSSVEEAEQRYKKNRADGKPKRLIR